MTDTAATTATTNEAPRPTVAAEFVAALEARRDVTAVRWRDADGNWQSWTTGELADRVARAAAGLRELGVGPGQRVMLMMRNIAEFHVADLAVVFCGATPVSIYNSSAPDQIAYLAGHAEATLAIVEDGEFLSRFDAVRDRLPNLAKFVVVRDVEGDCDDVVPWASLLDHEPIDLAEAAAAISPDAAVTIIYTSGTTGPPKGVVLTHGNVCAEVNGLRDVFDTDLTGKRVVSYLPMAHIAERAVSHYGMVFNGLEVSCCPDVNLLAEYLGQVRPQIAFGVPRVWEKIRARVLAAIAADPEKVKSFNDGVEAAKPIALARSWGTATDEQNATWDFLQEVGFRMVRELVGLDQVEYAITGAAPIPVEVIEWYNALGVPLSEVYGMSENTGAMTWTPRRIKPGTVGPAFPGAEVKIADDGEVLCRGPLVFPGYLKDPEKTAEAIDADGWLHTGDIGELDEDGYSRSSTARRSSSSPRAARTSVRPTSRRYSRPSRWSLRPSWSAMRSPTPRRWSCSIRRWRRGGPRRRASRSPRWPSSPSILRSWPRSSAMSRSPWRRSTRPRR